MKPLLWQEARDQERERGRGKAVRIGSGTLRC